MIKTGWVITNGKRATECQYRTISELGQIIWTSDIDEALSFSRRIDAERFSVEDEDAWGIKEHMWEDHGLLNLLKEIAPVICSYCCPSVRKEGEEWTHVDLCKKITKLISN